jgi:hypothetical protein
MNKFVILVLVFAIALTACDALALPTQAPVEPTSIPPTAEVIVVTVVMPVEVTAQSTAAPSSPAPTETQPPTSVPTEAAPAEANPTEAAPTEAASTDGLVSLDAALWGAYFKDVTYSNPSFSLRCPPKEITFTATVNDPSITAVDFYYRIEDRKGTTISEWKNGGRMQPTGNGAFSLTISGEFVHPDLRKALAWFDFQLIGLSKLGAAVGRTEKIMQIVTYTIDCQ